MEEERVEGEKAFVIKGADVKVSALEAALTQQAEPLSEQVLTSDTEVLPRLPSPFRTMQSPNWNQSPGLLFLRVK